MPKMKARLSGFFLLLYSLQKSVTIFFLFFVTFKVTDTMKILLNAQDFGLSEKNFATLVQLISSTKPNNSARVFLFGSRVLKTNRLFSDVDLLFEGFTNSQIILLDELLEDSDLPYIFDLVRSQNLASAYKESVDSSKKIFLEF